MPLRPKNALIAFLAAYWVTTIIGVLATILAAVLFQPPSAEELGLPFSQAPAYLMTLPYHPLYNLLVWPFAAIWYLRRLPKFADVSVREESLRLGAFWAIITIVIDLVGWVLIKHPWAMTFKEFYVDYQPWITLIYLVIFVSPVAVATLFQPRPRTVR